MAHLAGFVPRPRARARPGPGRWPGPSQRPGPGQQPGPGRGPGTWARDLRTATQNRPHVNFWIIRFGIMSTKFKQNAAKQGNVGPSGIAVKRLVEE